LEGYFIALLKLKSKAIPCMGHSINTMGYIILVSTIKGYCVWQGILNAHAIPFVRYPKNPLGSITYLLKLEKVLHNHTKTYKKTNSFIKVFYN